MDHTELTDEQLALTTSPFLTFDTADRDYALTTVYFFCVSIALIALFQRFGFVRPKSHANRNLDRMAALARYLSSRQFRIASYYTPTLGVIALVSASLTFLAALTFAVRTYYWPFPYLFGEFPSSPPLATRAGWISMGILPFVIALATKRNPIGALVGVSHEKLQVFHRWLALFMYVTSLIHTFPFIIVNINAGVMRETWIYPIWWRGVAALVAQTWLIALSWGIIRAPYYEFFKKMHLVAALLFMVFLYLHCENIMTSWHYVYATTAIYFSSFLLRHILTFLRLGVHTATIQNLPDGLVHVSIPVSAKKKWTPGQHVFVRFISGGVGLGMFSSHPFTIASVPRESNNQIDFVFRSYGGLTNRLHRLAEGKSAYTARVVLDGPYGGLQVSLRKFEEVVLIAGGTGATFVVPLFLDLVNAFEQGGKDLVCKKVLFVLAVRNNDSPTWTESQLARAAKHPQIEVRVHVTREHDPLAVQYKDPSNKESMDESKIDVDNCVHIEGRPNIANVLEEVVTACTGGKLGIAACGPPSMLYDARNKVAQLELDVLDGFGKMKEVWLHTEHYDW